MVANWTIELARAEYEKRGVKLLDDVFTGVDSPMRIIAKCGHEKTLSITNLLVEHGLNCRPCSYWVGSAKRKFDFEYVKKYFEDHGCTLLSTEYVNWRGNLEYIARCGHNNKLSFHKFRNEGQGRLCRPCGRPKREDHFKFNPDLTDAERITNRDYYAIIEWRLNVFKRDNYTCVRCGDEKGGNLNAHHLNGYNWDVENRLNLDNGTTLCDYCHSDFHKQYGYGNNTMDQFKTWFDGNTEVIPEIAKGSGTP